MAWDLDFISKEELKEHVSKTITHYGTKLASYDMKRFNRNIIDPVKMIFDKAVYDQDWETLIANETFRQRDKSSTNEIGYFHQGIFNYFSYCEVPPNGKNGGWDVICRSPKGYCLDGHDKVGTIFAEVKNKHNTMNAASSRDTYIKMQGQLLQDDNCACLLVEAIAQHSQNIIWKKTVNGKSVSHRRIRRVSIDRFYEIVTGESDAFYKVCMALPDVVAEVLHEREALHVPKDSVYTEMKRVAAGFDTVPDNMRMILSMYMLGFSTYIKFDQIASRNSNMR